jgi:CRISPR/Cas system-associated endonuclease Cas1
MGQFDKQNSRELQLKILELVEAKELTIKSAREFSAEQINEMYELWLKHRKKKKPDEQIQSEADDYEEENIDEY